MVEEGKKISRDASRRVIGYVGVDGRRGLILPGYYDGRGSSFSRLLRALGRFSRALVVVIRVRVVLVVREVLKTIVEYGKKSRKSASR